MVDCRRQIVEQVSLVAQGAEDSHLSEQPCVAIPDALDEHRLAAALEAPDDVREDMGSRRVDEFELRHAQHDDGDSREVQDLIGDAIGRGEEQRSAEMDDRDLLITRPSGVRFREAFDAHGRHR